MRNEADQSRAFITRGRVGLPLFEAKLKILLPEQYQESYENVRPVSMGSAGLKFGPDGRVTWDEIWGSFCDLAMAGGPPHRGTLLQAATRAEIVADRKSYRRVVDELCRGIDMVTGLAAMPSRFSGWIDVDCPSTSMAGWLARAINMENVSAHVDGMIVRLPAGPKFRLEKEIKNVIVSIAKTCHYWVGHTSVAQHRAIADFFKKMETEWQLIQTPFPPRSTTTIGFEELRDSIAARIFEQTGLRAMANEYKGWVGVDCQSVPLAVCMMRFAATCNILCRREEAGLYFPVNASLDRKGDRTVAVVVRVYEAALARASAS